MNKATRIKHLFLFIRRFTIQTLYTANLYKKGKSFNPPTSEIYSILGEYHQYTDSSPYLDKREWPKEKYDLTVIVAAYNAEKTLKACMDSIVNQETRFSFQTIVVNDGSTDKTSEIMREYETTIGNVLTITQNNCGPSAARNIAMEHCEGRFIMFVDSDDTLENGAIESLMAAAFAHDADVVAGNYRSIDENGKPIKDIHRYNGGKIQPMGNLHGQPWGKVYKKTIFDHLCFPYSYWYQDSIFAQIVWPMTNNVYTVPNIVYNYMLNPNGISFSGNSRPKTIDSLYITKLLLQEREKFGLHLTEQDYKHFLHLVGLTYRRTGGLDYRAVKCIFLAQCELYQKYFSGIKTDRHVRLQEALAERDFKKYMTAVIRYRIK